MTSIAYPKVVDARGVLLDTACYTPRYLAELSDGRACK